MLQATQAVSRDMGPCEQLNSKRTTQSDNSEVLFALAYNVECKLKAELSSQALQKDGAHCTGTSKEGFEYNDEHSVRLLSSSRLLARSFHDWCSSTSL